MLHRKPLIGIFDCFCNYAALYISSVDIVIFIISVSSGNQRFSNISPDCNSVCFCIDFEQVSGNIPSINMVNNILQPAISGCVKFWLPICEKLKRDFRMRQRQSRDQFTNMACFCHRSFQKLPPCRRVEKNLTDKKSRSIWHSDFFH